MVVFHLFPELALDESMNRNRQVFEKEKRFEPTDTVQVSRSDLERVRCQAWKISFSKPVIRRFLLGTMAAAKTHAHQAASREFWRLCSQNPCQCLDLLLECHVDGQPTL
jgi:uncharacterized Fe-S radical SAM superfamily protein PflX